MKLKNYIEKEGLSLGRFAEKIIVDRKQITERAVYNYAYEVRIPRPEIMREIVKVTNGEVMPNDFYEL